MDEKEVRKCSKFLSLVLRHQPESIGIELDPQGWTDVQALLRQAQVCRKLRIDMPTLLQVVETNNKQRFSLNADHSRIRANQGHSVQIDLGYQATEPPEILFHGTVPKFLDAIKVGGLSKMSRHAVHLSQDLATAQNVGSRRGKAIILQVKAQEMYWAGHEFHCSENGVWLTDHVMPEFIIFS